MEENPTMVVVAAALIDDQGRVLLQCRPAGRPMAGLWEFPGGKVEAGETPEAALARELREELGVSIEADACAPLAFASGPVGRVHMILLLYLLRAWRGAPSALHATELRWVHPVDMHELPMPPADRPLVERLVERDIRL